MPLDSGTGTTSTSMSGSERFDIATGILSVIVLFCALVERALPRTRLRLLDKRFKHTEAELEDLFEEGLLDTECALFMERLAR